MAELLLELFCEEIPAGLQGRGAADLMRLVMEGLRETGLVANDAVAFGKLVTPRHGGASHAYARARCRA